MNEPIRSNQSHPRESVLVVEDESYLRRLVSRWLSLEGYQAETAADANAAASMLDGREYHLLITDIDMPGRSGLDLLAACRQSHPAMAVLMMTGLGDRQTATRALELGAYGYVIKPFERNDLLVNVVNALHRRGLELQSQNTRLTLEEQVRERTALIRRTQEEIVLRLLTAAELRDQPTGAHVRRISRLSVSIARAFGWRESSCDDLELAAAMHDVGKIGIPDSILLKPGRLTPEEFEVIKTHAELGARILSGSKIPLLELAQEIALTHHERWDGRGYPQGLAKNDIPLSGRIVAIADVYDALTSDRPYRAALPPQEALDLMSAEREAHFDPELLDCFFQVLPDCK